MNGRHGLNEKTVAEIVRVLVEFPEVEKAVLFGSRAKETHTPGSDIDLALVGAHLDLESVGRIDGALDDLPIPYRFSLIVLNENTNPAVAAHIQRVGLPFFAREVAADVS